MLVKEVSRTLEELAAIIARLQFVAAELEKARKQEQRRGSRHRQMRHDRAMLRAAAARSGKSAFPFEVNVFNEGSQGTGGENDEIGKEGGVLYRY
jgi:hypothetical protein